MLLHAYGDDNSTVYILLTITVNAFSGKLIQFFGYDFESAFESHDHDECVDFSFKPRRNSVIEVVAAVEAEDKAAEGLLYAVIIIVGHFTDTLVLLRNS